MSGFRRVGDAAQRAHPEIQPLPDLDYLRGLKPTAELEGVLREVQERLRSYRSDGMNAPRQLVLSRDRINRAVEHAHQRDAIQASRPSDCWCLGAGGKGERAAVRPDAVGFPMPQMGGEERIGFSPEDAVYFLDRYCVCPEGRERKQTDDRLRAEVRAGYERQRAEHSVATIWQGAGVPERFAGCTLDSYPVNGETRPLLARVRNWLAGDAWALALLGSYGVGKSGLAIGVLRQAAEQGTAGLFVKVPDLLTRIKATFGPEGNGREEDVLASLRDVPLLVMDDLGADQSTPWAIGEMFKVLDHRHDALRKTIVTTNLDAAGMEAHLGKRNMERFCEGTMVLAFPEAAPNLRRRAAA